MSAADLLAEAHAKAVRLRVERGRLAARPADRVDPDLRQRLADHREELVAILKAAEAAPAADDHPRDLSHRDPSRRDATYSDPSTAARDDLVGSVARVFDAILVSEVPTRTHHGREARRLLERLRSVAPDWLPAARAAWQERRAILAAEDRPEEEALRTATAELRDLERTASMSAR